MIKFKKAYSIKIISILVSVVFLFTSTTYGIDLPRKSHLRKNLDFNKKEDIRYRCTFLAATIHKKILEIRDKMSPEEIGKIAEQELKLLLDQPWTHGINYRIDKEGNFWIYHEADKLYPESTYIKVYARGEFPGQFGPKKKENLEIKWIGRVNVELKKHINELLQLDEVAKLFNSRGLNKLSVKIDTGIRVDAAVEFFSSPLIRFINLINKKYTRSVDLLLHPRLFDRNFEAQKFTLIHEGFHVKYFNPEVEKEYNNLIADIKHVSRKIKQYKSSRKDLIYIVDVLNHSVLFTEAIKSGDDTIFEYINFTVNELLNNMKNSDIKEIYKNIIYLSNIYTVSALPFALAGKQDISKKIEQRLREISYEKGYKDYDMDTGVELIRQLMGKIEHGKFFPSLKNILEAFDYENTLGIRSRILENLPGQFERKSEKLTESRVIGFFKTRFTNLMRSKVFWSALILAAIDSVVKALVRLFLPLSFIGKGISISQETIFASDAPTVKWLLGDTIGISHAQHIVPTIPFVVVLVAAFMFSLNILATAERPKLKDPSYLTFAFAIAGIPSLVLDLLLFGAVTDWLLINSIGITNISDIFLYSGLLSGAIIAPLTTLVTVLATRLKSRKHQNPPTTPSFESESNQTETKDSAPSGSIRENNNDIPTGVRISDDVEEMHQGFREKASGL